MRPATETRKKVHQGLSEKNERNAGDLINEIRDEKLKKKKETQNP